VLVSLTKICQPIQVLDYRSGITTSAVMQFATDNATPHNCCRKSKRQ